MDDCPISFGPRAVLPLNPGFVSGAWESDPPGIIAQITFDTPMNTSVVPANASWDLEVDGVDTPISSQSWQTPLILQLETASVSDPSSTLTLELLVEDPNLHSISGMRPVLPFGPEDIFFAI